MSKINNYIMDQVERVEKEFKNMEYDVLFNIVFDLVMNNEEYDNLHDMDKFDYLYGNISELEENVINITKSKYQDYRKQLLNNIDNYVLIKYDSKYLIYKFDKNKYASYEPKHVTKEEYIINMFEAEMHDIYNMMVNGYVTVQVGSVREQRVLTQYNILYV